ncbi:MAG: GNAT family N-acetyltransferase [Candidatus Thermoplasmatota archaeon]|nr:GNAT family N-acetyltransferase [Euryarchaeota archaeon]MBU4031836.1 GNAT family N-acetyltransferase [Candidatus Thermoplasmatota archaeon]MBU4071076.1 GNAT family N-acetyltransferase [Candidatus Thermoplasmatota archaeon]MBU4145185.1 GNAT family N-acetyltransferase [Candidatus Thermoplasmatota archaeon]MBU4591136.1 GNAT family N-acetyltransferase [Candidatus Thermoplasmatota archaeon]
MSVKDVRIRNLNKKEDLENYTEFINLAHADYPGHKDMSVELVGQYIFGAPDFDEKAHFLAIEGSRIVGTANGDLESEEAGFISMFILPEYRFKGLEEIFYETVAEYLTSKDMKFLRTMVHAQFVGMMEFYREREFNDKWTHYSMTRDMDNPIPEIKISDDITIHVPDLENEYDAVRTTIATGFSDTMDSTDEMMMNFDEFTKEEYFSKDGIVAAKDANGRMFGVCIAAIHPAMKDTGHIPWLAVLKEHRGKGHGKALLLSSLAWLKENGVKQTSLSVELGNPGALKLYRSVGFEIESEMKFLEKKL